VISVIDSHDEIYREVCRPLMRFIIRRVGCPEVLTIYV
jgi:hypothetical protein